MRVYSLLFVVLIFLEEECLARTFSMLDPYDVRIPSFWNQKYLFWSISVLFVAVVRHLVKTYEITIPYSVFCMLFGLIWGIAALYNYELYATAKAGQTDAILNNITTIYLPLLVFSSAYSLDIHAFYKAFVQILVIALPVAFLSACVSGLMVNLVSDTTKWSFTECVLFGIITNTIYPTDVVPWLKESSVQTKYIMVLLHGESLMTTVTAVHMTAFLALYMAEWVVQWYQFVMGFLRMLLLGVPVGYLFGWLGVFGMKLSYNNTSMLMFLTIVSCYLSTYVGRWVSNAGLLSTMVTGIVMSMERCSLTLEAQTAIDSMWKMLMCVFNGIIVMIVGIRAPSVLSPELPFKEYILVFVTYLASNIARFLGYFCVMPLLSHTGYGMSFKNLIICVWCGLKSPMSLTFIIRQPGFYYKEPVKDKQFFLHMMGLYLLVQCINGAFVPVLLRALGLSEISTARQANMNNCMKHIYDARARAIAILKMDRFLSDANWPLVLTSTFMKHPYKKMYLMDEQLGADEEEEFFLGYKFTFCPDCQRHIPNEPTPRELREMMKEAKIRVLKLKKTIYSRRYENGLLSREGLRTLHHAVEIALDSDDAIIELDGLFKMFAKEGYIYRYLHLHLQQILRSKLESYKPPRKRIWFLCYKLKRHWVFFVVMSVVVIVDFVHLWTQLMPAYHRVVPQQFRKGIAFFFTALYGVEFVIKVLGYSWVSIWRHGIPTYFRSFWNVVEFLNLFAAIVDAIIPVVVGDLVGTRNFLLLNLVGLFFLFLRIINVLNRLRVFACFKTIPVSLLKCLDKRVNKHKAQAYELGKNCIAAEAEILDNLSKIIDNDKIRRKIKEKTEADRHAVCEKLTLAQKERPWVASTVKTKAAMRAVLMGMEDDIYELKVSGWVDDIEYNKLCASLSERVKKISTIDFIEPPSPKLIFNEITYMGEDEELIDFLWSNVSTRKYDPGCIVIDEGELVMGVYLIITGCFLVNYTPNVKATQTLKDTGALPVVDYITANTFNSFDDQILDYFGPGNTVGELCTLTGRPYDGRVIAQSHSEAYFISSRILRIAMKMDQDPVSGLACRIWKTIAFRIAVNVLTTVLTYRTMTREKICFVVERSFVPDLSNYKTFLINEMIQDLVLIEGVVVDFNTREVFTAPCHIPSFRTVQKLILPQSSAVNVSSMVEAKLMIIPAKDFDDYQIMLTVEESCDLVDTSSMGCLQRMLVDETASSPGMKILKRAKGAKMSMMRERAVRKKLQQAETAKNKITFANESSRRLTLSTSSQQFMTRKPAEMNIFKT